MEDFVLIVEAIKSLGYLRFKLDANPTCKKEFDKFFHCVVGTDNIGSAIYGDCDLTWEQVYNKFLELKAAEPMRLLRIERDRLLAETDWWAVSDRTMTSEQSAYRQALRDLPKTAAPVLDSTNLLGISGVDWPVKPQ